LCLSSFLTWVGARVRKRGAMAVGTWNQPRERERERENEAETN
jgi:hypothetical protein